MVKVESLVLTVQDMIRLALWFMDDNLSSNREIGKQILNTVIGDKHTRPVDFIEICLPTGAKIFKIHRTDREMKRHGSYWITGYDKRREEDGIVPLCTDVAAYKGFGKTVRIPRGF